jgi:hypothetical protein
MMPPAILLFHVQPQGGRHWRFWVPLFLLWPLFAFLLILFFPLILILVLARFRGSAARVLMVGTRESWSFACAMRGLHVEVEDSEQRVLIQLK